MRFEWTGEVMKPLRPDAARRYFTPGHLYPLEVREERSLESHNHFFASIKEAWDNLPADVAERFPSPDHLRRWALVKAGYRDARSIVCSSKAEARRVAVFAKAISDAVVVVRDAVVIVYTAKSQSARAMNKAEFQKSKEEVLEIVARLIGTSAKTLSENAGKAA